MSLNNLVKRLQDVMRNDAGINGDAQRIEQIVWILFLKIYDAKEQEWEQIDDNYHSILPDFLRWQNWAKDNKDGKAMTGDELLNFVNNELFPALKNLPISAETPMNQKIIRAAFEDNNNYMKNGILLRQVINIIDEINFEQYQERHAFGDIYENILKSLQSAGNAGEFYTPRAVTDFMAKMIKPRLGEKIADFACGTGGFLTSALKELDKQNDSINDKNLLSNSVYGIEKKALPHLLCITNLLLHDIDNPNVHHDNALEKPVKDYTDSDKFDVILMNPPYGGSEIEQIKTNFPSALRSSETADLFMSVIMYRLKKNGRVAIVLPDGFLFGTDNAKVAIKQKLMTEMNLHTVIRLPHSVFAPYTSITTNILFFDNTEPTKDTWFYRLDMPEGYKNFSKTKPMKLEHFNEVMEWWHNRQAIEIDGFDKARCYSYQEIADRQFNIDLCGFPHEEEEILPPDELIANYQQKRTALNADIDRILGEITQILGIKL
ncbi:class I SAM-dependent DNA methyltransferase [Actinobacillus pleuropneumoniae]|uniref:site-specific DNA-methyltransferase (adenine-specific) n=1 Tax=Actinobacillus pleuropneumoniae TaxID=715 RepID=A0A3S5F5Y3_ACTPL|nr:class I SAM-dependent DNA methyltransferase [Actinobacillus pleuropneumoniae]EFL77597.1 Type I restriction-modification system M subunit [Actinobacillus pleuropneumoniae serovar 2 str. 4226]EFM87203.1 Type I restriction-modification system M subunit [Actinobacillus pleuropneumoniae serovar 2 str. S1536]MEE3619592.1 class I SAM-dependent DNA methyltransferase [Actinobacillus pleuropneumoniae]UKH08031.1 type I restriction-modification system subunit M [Actinobacillus pleuropneumoniae]UKH46192